MAKAKATHKGTCQVCGHFQKLPGGRLSLHGYTKQWGCFEGTCWGSNNLPFEMSYDLVEKAIIAARLQIEGLRRQIAAIEAEDGIEAWHCLYRPATWTRKSSYDWTRIYILTEDVMYKGLSRPLTNIYGIEKGNDTTELIKFNGYEFAHNPIIKDVVKILNAKYIKHLLHTISQIQSYIGWQQDRILNWKPAPLTVIND